MEKKDKDKALGCILNSRRINMKTKGSNLVEAQKEKESIKPWLEIIGIVLATTTGISFFALVILSYALGINIVA